MKVRLLQGLIALSLLLAGCSGEPGLTLQPTSLQPTVTAPSEEGGSSAQASSPPDVSGTWTWSSTEHVTAPPLVAQFIFGIQPEGPVTQLRCDTSGTMTLAQTGASFSGSATQQAVCETGGGYVFVAPSSATSPVVDVIEGEIRGRSVQFVVAGGPLSCPFHGVITESDQGVATALRATGRCIVPGHPRSPLPLEPPPAGTSKTIEWLATRP